MSFELDDSGILRLAAWVDLPWLVHGFTTRRAGDFANGAPSSDSPTRLGTDGLRLRTVRQIHSDRVYFLAPDDNTWDATQRPEADALVTSRAGYVLGVRTADCLPLLLIDRRQRAVAAVHAGWRGVKQQIARSAVEAMNMRFGSKPGDLEAAIGPGIGACCFEVGPEVAEQFDAGVVVAPSRDAEAAGGARSVSNQPRPHVDLVEASRRQLLDSGLADEKIWLSSRCTCCDEAEFFSYRRGGDTARMLAFVGIKPA